MIWYGKQLFARLIYLPAVIAAQVTSFQNHTFACRCPEVARSRMI